MSTGYLARRAANQALAREKQRKHSRGMTRADVRTLAWMLPLALVLVIAWMFRSDPCLDDEIAGNWGLRNPLAADVSAATPLSSDHAVIENPYGIMACDYFPSDAENLVDVTILI